MLLLLATGGRGRLRLLRSSPSPPPPPPPGGRGKNQRLAHDRAAPPALLSRGAGRAKMITLGGGGSEPLAPGFPEVAPCSRIGWHRRPPPLPCCWAPRKSTGWLKRSPGSPGCSPTA